MEQRVLERIAETLVNIDSRLESLSSDINGQLGDCLTVLERMSGAVDEMRMDISGFEQNGSRVQGHLALILEAIVEVGTDLRSVETAVQGVETAVSSLGEASE